MPAMCEVVTSRDGVLQARADELTSRQQAIWNEALARFELSQAKLGTVPIC
jgi:hypothetical protein